MSRYIEADALLNMLPDDLPYKSSVKRIVMQAPTADVVEVRHGEWQKHFSYGCWYYDCPFCDDGFAMTEDFKPNQLPNYCSNCVAKMDGERREQ